MQMYHAHAIKKYKQGKHTVSCISHHCLKTSSTTIFHVRKNVSTNMHFLFLDRFFMVSISLPVCSFCHLCHVYLVLALHMTVFCTLLEAKRTIGVSDFKRGWSASTMLFAAPGICRASCDLNANGWSRVVSGKQMWWWSHTGCESVPH